MGLRSWTECCAVRCSQLLLDLWVEEGVFFKRVGSVTSNVQTAVSIAGVTKRYGEYVALRDLSLEVFDNEFFTLLGPSGCGKTTLLRVIAGFEEIAAGSILLYGENIGALPPNKRHVNTVFQQYALFPHMTVLENVLFGLRRLGVVEDDAHRRGFEALELVRMSGLEDRLPAQLSGGQQQRVALARALAPRPKVLLLDEPLSALDLKLRQAVRLELKQIQHETGITFVFVTHDQEEALTISDRIAVMNEGVLQQVGESREIYESPRNSFVASFIGETNLLPVRDVRVEGTNATCFLPGGMQFSFPIDGGTSASEGLLSIRPERLSLMSPQDGLLSGEVVDHIYLGTDVHVVVAVEESLFLTVRVQNDGTAGIPDLGMRAGVMLEKNAVRLLHN